MLLNELAPTFSNNDNSPWYVGMAHLAPNNFEWSVDQAQSLPNGDVFEQLFDHPLHEFQRMPGFKLNVVGDTRWFISPHDDKVLCVFGKNEDNVEQVLKQVSIKQVPELATVDFDQYRD